MTTNYSSTHREHPQTYRHQSKSPFQSGLLMFLIGILLVSCTSAESSEAISIVQAAYDRLNKGDVDGYFEFYSDDTISIGDEGYPISRQVLRDELTDIISHEHHFEISNLTYKDGVVTYTVEAFFRDNKVFAVDDEVAVIVDGKIIYDGREIFRQAECERDPSQAFCLGY